MKHRMSVLSAAVLLSLLAILLTGCPSPARRPDAAPGPNVAPPGGLGGPLARGADPAEGIADLIAGAGMVGARRPDVLVLGNVALVGLQDGDRVPAPGAGAPVAPAPGAAAPRTPAAPGPNLVPGAPVPGQPGAGGAVPNRAVDWDDLATRVRSAYPHIVEVRFAEDDGAANRLSQIVSDYRAGRPITGRLDDLEDLIDDMRVERGRAPAPAARPAPAPVPAVPGAGR